MEFVKAMKIRNRICEASKKQGVPDYCISCPLSASYNPKREACSLFIVYHPELAEPVLEQWDKEHPVQTRADKLREIFPNVTINKDGFPEICPPEIDCNLDCEYESLMYECDENICNECRRDFWTAESEPPIKE